MIELIVLLVFVLLWIVFLVGILYFAIILITAFIRTILGKDNLTTGNMPRDIRKLM